MNFCAVHSHPPICNPISQWSGLSAGYFWCSPPRFGSARQPSGLRAKTTYDSEVAQGE